MNRVTHLIRPGRGFADIGYSIEERRGIPIVVFKQATSFILMPVDTWDVVADGVDDEAGDVVPQLGKLFRSSSVTTPAKWGVGR